MNIYQYSTVLLTALSLLACHTGGRTVTPNRQHATIDRTVLPVSAPKPPVYTQLDVRNATPPPRFEVKAPTDAPNVVVVLVDDLGFAGTGKFGGPVATPFFF